MAQKRWYLIFILIFFVVAVIFYFAIDPLINTFISWNLIGIWITYTCFFFDRVKYFKEFNSPHNTGFFIFGSLMMGMLYSHWGNFTSILGWNIVPNNFIYLNLWQFIFALPYLFYGSILLVFCFSRYFFVYIGSRSVSSRGYGEFIIFFIILIEISYNVGFYYLINNALMPISLTHGYPDILIILLNVFNIFVLFRYAIFGKSSLLPVVPSERPTARREAPTTRRATPTTSRPQPVRPQRRIERPRPKPTPPRRPPVPATPPRQVPRQQKQRKKQKPAIKIDRYQPKAGRLSEEDFKCIFCFNLPKLPDDANRGIILCPTCRHPAHADEFKDWLKNSTLCSRCDAEIPARYRRTPNIISTKVYLKVYRMSMKKIKRRK